MKDTIDRLIPGIAFGLAWIILIVHWIFSLP